MLHMEIVQERLEREFDMTVITTVPNVSYIANTTKDGEVKVNNHSDLPDISKINFVEEPFISTSLITKSELVVSVMSLVIQQRGISNNQYYFTFDLLETTQTK